MRNAKKLRILLMAVIAAACVCILCSCALVDKLTGKIEEKTPTVKTTEQSETPIKPTESAAQSPTPSKPDHIHNYDAWKTEKEPTCTENGARSRFCSICKEKQEILLPATGHSPVIDYGSSPSCTTDGISNGSHCAVCEAVIEKQRKLEAWGHSIVIDQGIPASCEKEGKTDGKHCEVCGEVLEAQRSIPAFGHTEVQSKDVPATCTERGRIGGTNCSICGKILVEPLYTPVLGHSVVVDKPVSATCAHAGCTEGTHCATCGEVIIAPVVIAPLPHTVVSDAAVAPICEIAGRTAGSHCAVCGTTIEGRDSLPALGHDYNEEGFCRRCGEEKPKNLPITGIMLDKTKVRLEVGETIQLTATLLPEGAIKNTIVWINESKGEYYTVSDTGLVTALKPGRTTLTVYVEDRSSGEKKSFTKTCTIEITENGSYGDDVPVTGISVKKDHFDMIVGDKIVIDYTVLPENAKNKNVVFILEPGEDGKRDYLSVDPATGTVTALRPGSAKITLCTVDGDYTKGVYFSIYE